MEHTVGGGARFLANADAEQRAHWERLYETTQTKGDGETHPFLSPNDEFADYELWDKGNLDCSVAKKKEMLQFEYARRALQKKIDKIIASQVNHGNIPSEYNGTLTWPMGVACALILGSVAISQQRR